jgi:hypothetical protein
MGILKEGEVHMFPLQKRVHRSNNRGSQKTHYESCQKTSNGNMISKTGKDAGSMCQD